MFIAMFIAAQATSLHYLYASYFTQTALTKPMQEIATNFVSKVCLLALKREQMLLSPRLLTVAYKDKIYPFQH